MIFLVSMVPIVELRGAIPISQGFQLPLLQSYIICVIGNMLPVPIIYLFARRVLEWGKDKNTLVSFLPSVLKRSQGRTEAERKSRKRVIYRTAFICGYSGSGYRCMDRNIGSQFSGYGI